MRAVLAVRRAAVRGAALLLIGLALGGQASAQAPAPVEAGVVADGADVIDTRSRLAWSRCVEGMSWNGKTCAGQPLLMTHGEATARATQRAKAEGLPWRLPRVTELRRWAGRSGRMSAPGAALFPAAPVDWYWTLTASIDTKPVNPYAYDNIQHGRTSSLGLGVQQGWAVNMATGEAEGDVSRRSRLVVRLVRALP